jgi:glycosyltransferase involved in cell wall biosynthesis
MTVQSVIALLGRRDEPTDAVEQYCRNLGGALAAHDIQLGIRRVPWNQHGWAASLEALKLQAGSWRGVWVLVQYTALAWSARGFPGRFRQVLRILRRAGAQIAVVFHDAEPFGGLRLVDRLRRHLQVRLMRDVAAFADEVVFTVPPERLSWPERMSETCTFIPVGANLPLPMAPQNHDELHTPPTIAVFSITGGASGGRETRDIVQAVRRASQKLGRLRLLVFGRHAEVREFALSEAFRDVPVELQVEGVIEDQELWNRFRASDVLLFVRGAISSRRGSAIAGIACGLPVIAFEGRETASPITDAGVMLLPEELKETELQIEIGKALVRILSERDLRLSLVRRSREAQEKFFSWTAIATRYRQFLRQQGQQAACATASLPSGIQEK